MAMKISAPWVTYYRKLEALFKDDSCVKVVYEEDEKVVKLYVKGEVKAKALEALLPVSVNFGNVDLEIQVIPANGEKSAIELYRDAFSGNPIVSEILSDVSINKFGYVLFQPEVVQFWNDNLGDPNGMATVLAQDIAREVFELQDNVFFTTDKKNW